MPWIWREPLTNHPTTKWQVWKRGSLSSLEIKLRKFMTIRLDKPILSDSDLLRPLACRSSPIDPCPYCQSFIEQIISRTWFHKEVGFYILPSLRSLPHERLYCLDFFEGTPTTKLDVRHRGQYVFFFQSIGIVRGTSSFDHINTRCQCHLQLQCWLGNGESWWRIRTAGNGYKWTMARTTYYSRGWWSCYCQRNQRDGRSIDRHTLSRSLPAWNSWNGRTSWRNSMSHCTRNVPDIWIWCKSTDITNR